MSGHGRSHAGGLEDRYMALLLDSSKARRKSPAIRGPL